MEALIAAADRKDKDAILNVLDKVHQPSGSKPKSKRADETTRELQPSSSRSVNLGKKAVQPRGGFSDDVKQNSSAKK